MRTRLRLVVALLAGLLIASGLSACQTHVGAAAYVGNYRISEKTLNSYVTSQAKPYPETDNATHVTTTTYPKSLVLNTLLLERIVTQSLNNHGGPPSASELATARNATLAGGLTEAAEIKSIATRGYTARFEPVILHVQEYISILAKRTSPKGTITAAVLKELQTIAGSVRVSPRYGTYSATNLSLTGGDPAPSFLKLNATKPAA